MRVLAFDSRSGLWGWERGQTGDSEQESVRGIEEVQMCIEGTIGGGDEDGGLASVVDGDIGLEAAATTRLFNDVRRGINWQDVNPAETDAGWLACVVESFLADEA